MAELFERIRLLEEKKVHLNQKRDLNIRIKLKNYQQRKEFKLNVYI